MCCAPNCPQLLNSFHLSVSHEDFLLQVQPFGGAASVNKTNRILEFHPGKACGAFNQGGKEDRTSLELGMFGGLMMQTIEDDSQKTAQKKIHGVRTSESLIYCISGAWKYRDTILRVQMVLVMQEKEEEVG